MITIVIPGQVVLLRHQPKTDASGAQVMRDGIPLSRVTVVAAEDGETLNITVPTAAIGATGTLRPVEVVGLRVGAFKDRLFFHAEAIRPAATPAHATPGNRR